jgi:hypothetical protein
MILRLRKKHITLERGNSMEKLFETLSEVKQANQEIGNHWFSRDTMKFWGCKIETSLLRGRFFITSEWDLRKTKRLFTIRFANPDGSIETLPGRKGKDGFQCYWDKDHAKQFLYEYIKNPAVIEQ